MLKTQFTLVSKRELTHDVYELVYHCEELIQQPPKPGQYVMFQLAPWLNRSYSLSSSSDTHFTLIIKRIPDGKGSPMICDAKIGMVFSGIMSLGHFILRDTPVPKCFIGTWTGFAPLYYQMIGCIEAWITNFAIAFIFGVREFNDVFYSDEIHHIWKEFDHFDYITYLSREEKEWFQLGYVIDWIIPENIRNYQEFYLCGSPAMVKNAREKLEALGVANDQIFWEQY
jgi:NAD(P)H-flavin reductase